MDQPAIYESVIGQKLRRVRNRTEPLDRGLWDNLWHEKCTSTRHPSYFWTALFCLRYIWYGPWHLLASLGVGVLTSQALLREQRTQRTAPTSVAIKSSLLCKRCNMLSDPGYFCQSCGGLVCARCLSYKRRFLYPLLCADCELAKEVRCACCEGMVAIKYICQRCKLWTCEKCLSFRRRWDLPLCRTCEEESYDPSSSETRSTRSLPDYNLLTLQ